MLQTEFESRTGVKVSYEEYKTIESFYNTVECDKDEFCKMWCKMNASRVKAAKAAADAARKENANRERLFQLLCSLQRRYNWDNCFDKGVKINEHYKMCLEEAGKDLNYDDLCAYDLMNIIRDYLKL